MGNEMGNNNTSELREEEKAKAEDPETSLLFGQKEGSDDADRVNGDHHVTKKEEIKTEACNTAEFQVVSEKLPNRTKEDNEVQAKSKENEGLEFDFEENRSDGNEHEHEKKASNQREEEGERGSNLNKTILASHEPKIEKPEVDNEGQAKSKEDKEMEFDSEENRLEDRNEHEDGKQASNQKEEEGERGSNLTATILALHESKIEKTKEDNEVKDKEMEFDSDEDRSDGNEHQYEKQASNQTEEEGERDSSLNTTILELHEPKLEKTTNFKSNQHELVEIKAGPLVEDSNKSQEECKDALELSLNNTCHPTNCAMADSEETTDMDQVVDTVRDTNKENEGEGKRSNFNMIKNASEDPKDEKTSDCDVDRDTDKENDGGRGTCSNFNTITHASKDPKSEMTSDFDTNQVIDTDREACKENDGERGTCSNFNTITHASKDPKSEMTSDFDTNQVIDRDACKENDGERGKGSIFDKINASEDPKSEMTSDFDTNQVIDRDACKENDGERGKGSIFDKINASEDPKFEKTSILDIDQVIITDRDTNKENNEEMGKGSNFNTITHVSNDPKSENTSNLRSIQHKSPETRGEPLAGSSDDESSKESTYVLGVSLKRNKDNDDLIEPRSCHEYTMPTATNVDTKDEESTTNLTSHNSSRSPPKESLVIDSPKSSMQVPEVEDRCTVLQEESQLREEHLKTETVVQDKIPTQSKISNGLQEEFNTIGSHSENNAEETEVSPEFVAMNKNQNEAPGEDCEDSDEEYLEISEQGMHILNVSMGDCKHKNEEMGETMTISTINGHEAERREPVESVFEPVLGFQPQVHQKETSITFQNAESTDESMSAPRREAKTETEKSKKTSSDSQNYIQTALLTLTETKTSTNPLDEQSVTRLPFSTFGGEDQESPGRTSNESNSDNSIGHIEMRKSPSFNVDIQSEGRAEETEKVPLLYQIKTIEDLPNMQEISFPNPMEKRVVKLGRSDSEKSRPSFPGFVNEKEESEMDFKSIDKTNLAADKKTAKDLPPTSPIRKGKRRTKSLIFGTCICCSTAIN